MKDQRETERRDFTRVRPLLSPVRFAKDKTEKNLWQMTEIFPSAAPTTEGEAKGSQIVGPVRLGRGASQSRSQAGRHEAAKDVAPPPPPPPHGVCLVVCLSSMTLAQLLSRRHISVKAKVLVTSPFLPPHLLCIISAGLFVHIRILSSSHPLPFVWLTVLHVRKSLSLFASPFSPAFSSRRSFCRKV